MAAAPPGARRKVLMVVLGGVKDGGGYKLRRHGVALLPESGDELFRHGLLCVILIKNGGPVLRAHIRALPINLRGIVDFKEQLGEFLVGNLGRIIRHAHGFGVARASRAHVLVGGVGRASAGVAGLGIADARHGLKGILHAPEAAPGEDRFLGALALLALLARPEVEREGIDAMSGVFGGKTFAFKNVAQVTAAGGAEDFRTPAVGVGTAAPGSGHFVVKTGPAAAGVELVAGAVQRGPAAAADIGSVGLVVPVAAAEGRFRGPRFNNGLFFGIQGFHNASLRSCLI